MPETKLYNAYTARSVMSKLYDHLFGFDFFISYSRGGGQDYASALCHALEKGQKGSRKFKCFLDEHPEEGFQAGHELQSETQRAINQASAMIVVVSRQAFDSPHVAREVELFAKTDRQIFPIEIDDTLKLAIPGSQLETELIGEEASAKMLATLRSRLFQSEPEDKPTCPSEEVIARINNALKYTRRLLIRNVALSAGVVLLASLALLLGYFFYIVGVARDEAVIQKKVAMEQRNVAVSRQLAAESVTMLGQNYDLALLLGVEANNVESTVEARASLLKGLQAYPLLDSFGFHAERVEMSSFLHAPGEVSIWSNVRGDRVIVGACGNNVACLDNKCQVIECDKANLTKNKAQRGDAIAFRHSAFSLSPGGKAVAFILDTHRIVVWDEEAGCALGLVSSEKGWYSVLALSPEGRLVVAQEKKGTPAVYDVTTNKRIAACANAAFTSDGSVMALIETFGDDNRTIILWDVRQEHERGRLTTEIAPISVGFSHNGLLLASSGAGNQISIWNVENLERTLTLTTTTPLVREFAFSPDSTHLAVAGLFDVTLWDLESLDPQVGMPFRPALTENDVPLGLGVSFCAQGKALAVTACGLPSKRPHYSAQTGIQALAAIANREKFFTDAHQESPASGDAKPLPYSQTLPGSRDDCVVVILEIPELKEVRRFDSCGIGAVSPNGMLLGTVGRDRFSVDIQYCSSANRKPNPNSSQPERPAQDLRVTCSKVCTLRLPSTQRRIRNLNFTATRDAVLVTDETDCLVRWLLPPKVMRTGTATMTDAMLDGLLRLPLVESVQHIEWSPPWKTIRVHSGNLESERLLAFNQTEHTMLTLRPGPNPVVTVRDAKTSRVRALHAFIGLQGKPKLSCVAVDGSILASSAGDSSVHVLRTEKGQSALQLDFPAKVQFLTCTRDRILVILDDGALWVWNSIDGSKQLVEPCEAESYPVAAVSPDGTWFARARRRSQEPISIELFDLTHNTSRRLKWQGDQLGALVMSSDNLRLAGQSGPAGLTSMGSDSTTLWVWDLSSVDPEGRPLAANLGRVRGMAWSPDARVLATLVNSWSDNSSCASLWDVPSGKLIGMLPVKDTEGILFSPDGRTLATTGEKGTEFWITDLESWKAKACRVANRNLTEKEWHQYFQDAPYKHTCPRCPEPDIGGTRQL